MPLNKWKKLKIRKFREDIYIYFKARIQEIEMLHSSFCYIGVLAMAYAEMLLSIKTQKWSNVHLTTLGQTAYEFLHKKFNSEHSFHYT